MMARRGATTVARATRRPSTTRPAGSSWSTASSAKTSGSARNLPLIAPPASSAGDPSSTIPARCGSSFEDDGRAGREASAHLTGDEPRPLGMQVADGYRGQGNRHRALALRSRTGPGRTRRTRSAAGLAAQPTSSSPLRTFGFVEEVGCAATTAGPAASCGTRSSWGLGSTTPAPESRHADGDER